MIIDTDVGYDDLLAILYLLADGSVTIDGFTVVNGIADVADGANALLSMQDILIAQGALPSLIPVYLGLGPAGQMNQFPSQWRNQAASLNWPAPKESPQTGAVSVLTNCLAQAGGHVLAIGPLTNIAAALPGRTRSFTQFNLTIMGGAMLVPGNLPECGNPKMEGNIYVDPKAAYAVFNNYVNAFTAAPAPSVVLAPLDACECVPVDATFVNNFAALQPSAAKEPFWTLANQILQQIYTEFLKDPPTKSPCVPPEPLPANWYYAFDPLAAVACVNPSVLLLNTSPALSSPTSVIVNQNNGQTGWRSQPLNCSTVALQADPDLFWTCFSQAFTS